QRSQIAPLLVTSEMIGNDDPSDAATVQAVDERASNEAGRSGHEIAALRTEKSVATTCPRSLSTSPRRSFRSFHHKMSLRRESLRRLPRLRCSVPNFRAESRLGRSASVELFPGSLTPDWRFWAVGNSA